MKVLVVYESMYGNTHMVAEAIAAGARGVAEAEAVSLERVTPDAVRAADLLVVGGPTHVHTMSRPMTRKAARDAAAKDDELRLDEAADAAEGVREWLASLGPVDGLAAAFDTRIDAAAILTGRASKGIARFLRKHGYRLIADPESFLVTKTNDLVPGEETRAEAWGHDLVARLATAATS
jgi:menaquinone-dependent protoporphyrinogen IX oxidase